MKFKKGKWLIDSRSLVEFRKDGFWPKLYVHEKFEKPLKIIIWTIAIAGFITIFLSIESYLLSVSVGLGLFALSFVFDRAVVKHTSMVLQPLPDFPVDFSQWKNVMTVAEPDENHINFIGLVYRDLEYGGKFFKYLKEWNLGESNDKDGNIVFSIVKEENDSFTFYIYANPNRKRLKELYDAVEMDKFLSKKKQDKVHEQLVMETSYWHNIKYSDNNHMKKFLKYQPADVPFMLVPTMKTDQGYAIDLESQIILSGYRYSKRKNLEEHDRETQLAKMEERWNKQERK